VVYEDDQKYVIANIEDTCTIRLIDFDSKNEIHEFNPRQEGQVHIKTLTVSHDSNFMLVGYSDGSVRVFNLPAKQQKSFYPNIMKGIG